MNIRALTPSFHAALAATLITSIACARQTSIEEVKPVRITDNIYTFDGPMDNCAALVGQDGVLLVDTTESMEMTQAVDAALKTVCERPVKYLVLTHKHFDHVNGNALYGSQGVKIIAQTSVRKALQTEIPYYADKPLPAESAPTITFENEMTLHFDGEDIWLYHPQTEGAHTGGDIVVYFKKANVIHVGDLFCHGIYLFIDSGDSGWLQGEIESLKDAIAQIDDKTVVIPGHGDISDKRGLQHLVDTYTAINDTLEAMVREGKTLDEIKAAHITAPYAADFNQYTLTFHGGRASAGEDLFIESAYRGLLAHQK